jgi:hypothetical protein
VRRGDEEKEEKAGGREKGEHGVKEKGEVKEKEEKKKK